ncbi:MAG: S-layer homology domain-containing protein [Halanaerobiales bacterium]
MYKKIYILITLIILLTAISTGIKAVEPTDIKNHWAQDYIINMLDREIMKVDENGHFHPDENINRGEFARAIAKLQNFRPDTNNQFSDLKDYPDAGLINTLVNKGIINGYPDGQFKPEKSLSRAELITILIKSLGVQEEQKIINLEDEGIFQDIDNSHWAANNIKIAHKLNITFNNPDNKLHPDQKVTRAEATRYLEKSNDLSNSTGYITDIYPTSNKISVNLLEGERKILDITDETLMGRNNRIVSIDDILKTDKVFIITENGKTKYLKAYGMITTQDLSTEVSKITQGTLEPEDIEKMAEGDLDLLRPRLIELARDQLVKEGLSENEVKAIMNTDWDELELLSKDRLSEAVAIRTGLPLVVTRGVLEGDWDKIKTYAQVEVVQRLIQEMLNSELIS